jgi:hypothetical protein
VHCLAVAVAVAVAGQKKFQIAGPNRVDCPCVAPYGVGGVFRAVGGGQAGHARRRYTEYSKLPV